MVAAEECPETEGFGALGHGQQGVVGGALLGLGEDTEIGELHGSNLLAVPFTSLRRNLSVYHSRFLRSRLWERSDRF